jgi:hypothetical protein
MNEPLITDMYVDRTEWDAREAERYAARNPRPVAKPKKACVIRVQTNDERDPFVLLRAALSEPNGRAIIKAIVAELGKQKKAGWSQGSVRLALETARRTTKQPAGMDGDFRIDNRVAPAIARWCLQVKPALRGWLEVRRMVGETAEAANAYSDPNAEMPFDDRLMWVDPAAPFVPMNTPDPNTL